ncbi:MAG: hypothetical protein Q9226_001477 [Calogaya cf. arnoldii]
MHYKTALFAALAVASFTVAAPIDAAATTEVKEPGAVSPRIDFFYLGYDALAEAGSALEDREVKNTVESHD